MKQAFILLVIIVTALAAALAVVLVFALLPYAWLIGVTFACILIVLAIASAVYVLRRFCIDLTHREAVAGVVHLCEHGGYLLQAGKVEALVPASVHIARYSVAVEADPEPQAKTAPQLQLSAPIL